MTQIKMCGLQTLAAIQAANACEVEYIGFVFAPSRRRVSVEQAKRLRPFVHPSIKVVGVFVNETVTEMHRIAQEVGLDILQLHGDETVEVARQLAYPVWKAIPMDSEEAVEEVKHWQAQGVLPVVDAPGQQFRGGAGETFNWQWLKGLDVPFILAGGLNHLNVREAVRSVQPSIVDVSSGIETKRQKDPIKMKVFVEAVRGAR